MKLRAPMMLAGLLAATLHGQPLRGSIGTLAQAPTGSAGPAGQTSTPGILHTPSTGVPSGGTAPRQPHSRGTRSRTGAGSGNRNSNSLPPGPDADSKIQIIGYPATTPIGTADRPLLPIVGPGNSLGIPSGTPIQVRLNATVDSGHAHNGQTVDGKLDAPIGNLPAGTPVRLTVVQSAEAGTISSYGQLSLQVVSIANRPILSNIVTALGKPGEKELPDAAPARGTEAVFSADQPISLPAA